MLCSISSPDVSSRDPRPSRVRDVCISATIAWYSGSHDSSVASILVVSLGLVIRILDWDESNAYCNIPRQDLELALQDYCSALGVWAVAFYAKLLVRVVTARGLTATYLLAHGCG